MHEQEIEILDTAPRFDAFVRWLALDMCVRARHALTMYVSKIHKIYESRRNDKAVKANEKNKNSFKM